MKKHGIVKQKNLLTQDKSLMYNGEIDCLYADSCTTLSYIEYDGNTNVKVKATNQELTIERKGEMLTLLKFISQEKTIGEIETKFGRIEIDLYTHKYIKKDTAIAIEYDVMQEGTVLESYRIIWDIKEDTK